MKKYILIAAAAFSVFQTAKADQPDGGAKSPQTIKITADKMAADNSRAKVCLPDPWGPEIR